MDYQSDENDASNVGDALVPINRAETAAKGTTSYYIVECSDGYLLTNPSGTTFSRTRYLSGTLQYKQWKFTSDLNGNYLVYSSSNSSQCLTVNPTTKAVSLSNYSPTSDYQKWKMYYSTSGNALVCVVRYVG